MHFEMTPGCGAYDKKSTASNAFFLNSTLARLLIYLLNIYCKEEITVGFDNNSLKSLTE